MLFRSVYTAVNTGTPVKIQHLDSPYGVLSFTHFNIAESFGVIASSSIVYYDKHYVLAELAGNIEENIWNILFTYLAEESDIPEALININKDDEGKILQVESRQWVKKRFQTDETLLFEDGVLRVNTTSSIDGDNTLPITSAAVQTTVGNIEILLGTI